MVKKINLEEPDAIERLKELEVGEVVYLTGKIVSVRDKAHMRILKLKKDGDREKREEKEIPKEVFQYPIYHCGPLLKDGKVISAGPTTSARMNAYTPDLLKMSKFPVVIGKGGMCEEVAKALMGRGCYLAFPGGAGALAAKSMEVEKVYWEDLGMAEAVYVLRVKDFGPCIVAMDSKGGNLYREVEKRAEKVFKDSFN